MSLQTISGRRLVALPDHPCFLGATPDAVAPISLVPQENSLLLVLPDRWRHDHRILIPRPGLPQGQLVVDGVSLILPTRIGPSQLRLRGSPFRFAPELVVYARSSDDPATRCPYCHWSIATTFVRCPSCGTIHHADCWSEHAGGTCATQRCRARYPGPPIGHEQLLEACRSTPAKEEERHDG